jgi:hypothetical protein
MGSCASVQSSTVHIDSRQRAYEIPCELSAIPECGQELASVNTARDSNQHVAPEEDDSIVSSNKMDYADNGNNDSDDESETNRSTLSLTRLVLSQRLYLTKYESDGGLMGRANSGADRPRVLSRNNSAASSSVFSAVHSLISSLTSHSSCPSASMDMDDYMSSQQQMMKCRSLSNKREKWVNDLAERYIVLPSGEVKLRKARSSGSVLPSA